MTKLLTSLWGPARLLLGKVKEAVVSVTCEITLTRFRDDIGWKKDEGNGLWKLSLEPGGD